MKQQFAAKHPWTILAAGAAIQVLTGIPAAWGVFQQPVMEEYGFSREQGPGWRSRCSLRPSVSAAPRRLSAGQPRPAVCRAVGHGTAGGRIFCGGHAAGRQCG